MTAKVAWHVMTGGRKAGPDAAALPCYTMPIRARDWVVALSMGGLGLFMLVEGEKRVIKRRGARSLAKHEVSERGR